MTESFMRDFFGMKQANSLEVTVNIRDLFAMVALNGIIISDAHIAFSSEWASQAYKIADAMLEARKS